MTEIKEIGLEKEVFLLKDGKIMEPKLFGFPYDEMGFLIELRSLPSDRAYPVITTLYNEQLQYKLRANKFGMELKESPFKYESKGFVDHIEDTYHISQFPDYTKNIYNLNGDKLLIHRSHHLGIFPVEQSDSSLYRLTAGIHVHFSSRDSETGKIIELPIEEIVSQMDETFRKEIELSGRIKGEYEIKTDGHFEYRSLPCDMDVIRVVKESFRILREI